MNIFYLDKNPWVNAEMHCDKHVCKMIVEYAQLLSTAHRVLDGKHTSTVVVVVESNAGDSMTLKWKIIYIRLPL